MMATSSVALAQPEPPEQAPIPAHTAVYEVLRYGSKVGEVMVELSEADNGVWLYETETRATARLARLLGLSAAESAYFMWHTDQQQATHDLVLMLSYYQLAQSPMRNRFWRHQVDWTEGVSTTETREGDFSIEVEAGVVDPLTLRLQLAAMLQHEQHRGDDLHFKVLERTSVEDQQFLFRGREPVELPMGCLDSLHFHRFRREGSARNYDSWHHEGFYWMPVRMLQNRDDQPYIDIRLIETSLALAPQPCS
jgi:hypothetical protein